MSSKDSQHKLTQSERFIEAARELGCDEDEAAFDDFLKKVAKAPPPRKEEKPEPKRKAKK